MTTDSALVGRGRLQAAVDKLERLRAASTPGDWDFESMPETGESRIYSEADGFAFMAATTVTFYPVPGGVKPGDAHLVVTLHRTIDAQLAILRGYSKVADLAIYSPVHEHVLALADAILGSDS